MKESKKAGKAGESVFPVREEGKGRIVIVEVKLVVVPKAGLGGCCCNCPLRWPDTTVEGRKSTTVMFQRTKKATRQDKTRRPRVVVHSTKTVTWTSSRREADTDAALISASSFCAHKQREPSFPPCPLPRRISTLKAKTLALQHSNYTANRPSSRSSRRCFIALQRSTTRGSWTAILIIILFAISRGHEETVIITLQLHFFCFSGDRWRQTSRWLTSSEEVTNRKHHSHFFQG